MKKREKRLTEYCKRANCEFCRIEKHFAEKGDWIKEYLFTPSLYAHSAICTCVFDNQAIRQEQFQIVAKNIGIAHFFPWETHGLTGLANANIFTMEEIVKRTRDEVGEVWGVGERSLRKLDTMLQMFGWWYDDLQGKLIGPDTPAFEIR
jgi:hypothetical protein